MTRNNISAEHILVSQTNRSGGRRREEEEKLGKELLSEISWRPLAALVKGLGG